MMPGIQKEILEFFLKYPNMGYRAPALSRKIQTTRHKIRHPLEILVADGYLKIDITTHTRLFYLGPRGKRMLQRREHYRKNKDTIKAKANRYYRQNGPKVRERARKYREANRATDLERKRIWYQKNREKINERRKERRSKTTPLKFAIPALQTEK